MKKLLILFMVFIFMSCNKENPTSQNDYTNQSYLGNNSTQREYEITDWMFKPSSNTPYFTVPESLCSKLTFDTSLSNQGIYYLSKTNEVIIPYEENHLVKTKIESHNLELELENLSKNEEYRIGRSDAIDGAVWLENESEMYIQGYDSTKYILLKKPLFIGREWIREKHPYTNDQGVTESFQQECKVISKENIQVKAGKFTAYKIEVANHWIDLNSKSINNYEYYVPNVGLVLFESDGNIYRLTVTGNGPSTTIYIRHKERKELVSFNNYYLY